MREAYEKYADVQVGDWLLDLRVDDDGQLAVYVWHMDGSEVHECRVDIAQNANEWAERFTTTEIERRYAHGETT